MPKQRKSEGYDLIVSYRVAGFYRVLSLVVKVYSKWCDTLPLILWF